MCKGYKLRQSSKGGWGNLDFSQDWLILWLPTEAEMLLTPICMVHYTHCCTNWQWSGDEHSALGKEHTEIQNCRWFWNCSVGFTRKTIHFWVGWNSSSNCKEGCRKISEIRKLWVTGLTSRKIKQKTQLVRKIIIQLTAKKISRIWR